MLKRFLKALDPWRWVGIPIVAGAVGAAFAAADSSAKLRCFFTYLIELLILQVIITVCLLACSRQSEPENERCSVFCYRLYYWLHVLITVQLIICLLLS